MDVREAGPEYGGYFNFSNDGVQVGRRHAQRRARAALPTTWTVYLGCEKAEGTVVRAGCSGGA
jgi:hypothetical protein